MKGLLFITHRTEKYDYLQSLEIALKGGCRQIQLRMKGFPMEEVEKVAIQAKSLCDDFGADLYINDFAEICLKVNARGVHLGRTDGSPSVVRSLIGDKYSIGGTANTFEDIRQWSEEGVDYIGLGPFRFTSTKVNVSPVLGLEGYRNIIRLCRQQGIDLPILAVGGITQSDVPALMQTGIAGIAVSSAILNADDPVEEIKKFLEMKI